MPRLALTFSKFDNLRNYRAREGDGKSLPRGEGFRERVTFTKKERWAYILRREPTLKFALTFSKFDNLRNLRLSCAKLAVCGCGR